MSDEFPLQQNPVEQNRAALWPYLLAGVAFGFVAVRSEIVSWYRIYEMFHFASFHMYGVIGSAVLTGALSLWVLRRWGYSLRPPEPGRYRYALGGLAFGLGWGLVGACPGPIYALLGSGVAGALVVFLGALLGTYLYGLLQRWLPH
ncbi:DUF6691 family protein [Meiothermus sp. QL-1]|uniref:DUF6691 family protein n=1 Tax=Meiothermus sp. QL-1 TaxID=2058095 RepID=UPI001F38E407|nr:DUF6691 family protein [Meiothermus sp. QL-1]